MNTANKTRRKQARQVVVKLLDATDQIISAAERAKRLRRESDRLVSDASKEPAR